MDSNNTRVLWTEPSLVLLYNNETPLPSHGSYHRADAFILYRLCQGMAHLRTL